MTPGLQDKDDRGLFSLKQPLYDTGADIMDAHGPTVTTDCHPGDHSLSQRPPVPCSLFPD